MKAKLARRAPNLDLDLDNPDWTAADFASARPTRDVMPELAEWYNLTCNSRKSAAEMVVSVRLDRDVVEALRASGRGWQGRVNEILRKAVLE
jgi:uncharacterized protein (DUF4415 family)